MEVEIKIKLRKEKYDNLLKKFLKEGTNKKEKFQNDMYLSPKEPNFFGELENDQCLRIRMQPDKDIFGYKTIKFGENKEDIHIIEYETEIKDRENLIQILKALSIEPVITLKKKRTSFIYQNLVEVSLDEVEDLGYFIEIEVLDSKMNIQKANEILLSLVEEWDLDMKDRDLTGYANELYDLKYRQKEV